MVVVAAFSLCALDIIGNFAVKLAPGNLVGPYEIVTPLGAGGMGDVYRARDQRLNRDVAVKVLPDEFARDAPRVARFEREAQALASLNHPNILRIHDFGRHDGVFYAAMELVEGETLRSRLMSGALPARKAMDYAAQAARGLAAAHDKGVIHRDLKPENIMLSPDGRVTILDFGLAAQADPIGAAVTYPGDPRDQTSPGTVLGTVGYMSPEQVRGEKVDARSDLFSLGAVLFEMLTGHRAFAKDTAAETMTAILKEDPHAPADAADMPPALHAIVLHCLEKNPAERFQSARDLAFALEQSSGSRSSQTRGSAIQGPAARQIPWLAIALIMLVAGVAIGYLVAGVTTNEPVATTTTSQPSFTRLTFGQGIIRSARFAPDGSTIVYGAAWGTSPLQVFMGRTDSITSKVLQLPAAQVHSVSSRGELAITVNPIYEGWMGQGTLARAPLLGGGARDILENVREADWAPDGETLAIVRRVDDVERLEFPPGQALYQTRGYISNVRFSPSGDRIAFADHPVFADDLGSPAIVTLKGEYQALTPLVNGLRGVAWGPGGKELWFSFNEEGGCRIDASDLGSHRRTLHTAWTSCVLFDVSPDGRALIGSESSVRHVEVLSPDTTAPRSLPLTSDQTVSRAISADGTKIVLTDQAVRGYAAYIRETSGAPPIRVGSGDGLELSPDGRWVVAVTQTPPLRLLLHPTGAGETRELPNPDEILATHVRWMPDSRRIVFFGATKSTPSRGYVQAIDGDLPKPFTPPVVEPSTWWTFALSPDGTRVTARNADGNLMLWPIAGGAPEPLPRFPADGVAVQWSQDGRSLIVGQRIAAGWALSRYDIASGRMHKLRDVVANEASGFRLTTLSITPDGRSMVHSYARLLVDLILASGLK